MIASWFKGCSKNTGAQNSDNYTKWNIEFYTEPQYAGYSYPLRYGFYLAKVTWLIEDQRECFETNYIIRTKNGKLLFYLGAGEGIISKNTYDDRLFERLITELTRQKNTKSLKESPYIKKSYTYWNGL